MCLEPQQSKTILEINMEVSITVGTPNWMVFNGKSQSKMDDVGISLFQETSIFMYLNKQ